MALVAHERRYNDHIPYTLPYTSAVVAGFGATGRT